MNLKTLALLIVIPTFGFTQNLYFPPVTGSEWDTISPQSLNWCQPKIDSLYTLLEENSTKSFILLKDGKIVLEKYFDNHTVNSLWQWASAGKTITSFMVGIAQQENFLTITDTTSAYLGQGWTSLTPEQEEKITIEHQLTMTTGLSDLVSDPYCTLSSCLIYEADPGTRWAYQNAPYTLLDNVIANATSTTLNTYTTQKLKNPTGMTGLFVPVEYNNVFFSNTRSMARFGLLILNDGNWDGNQIMTDTEYFNQMVTPSQNLNNSYGYLWWLNGQESYMYPGTQFVFSGSLNPSAPEDVIMGLGKDGQFLNVAPSQNMVWVRMGNAPDDFLVPSLLNDEIWQYINDLECDAVGINETGLEHSIQLFPNPSTNVLQIKADQSIAKIETFNAQGQLVETFNALSNFANVDVSNLPLGLFTLKITLLDGNIFTKKWIKK